jgi:hypothetical protein
MAAVVAIIGLLAAAGAVAAMGTDAEQPAGGRGAMNAGMSDMCGGKMMQQGTCLQTHDRTCTCSNACPEERGATGGNGACLQDGTCTGGQDQTRQHDRLRDGSCGTCPCSR